MACEHKEKDTNEERHEERQTDDEFNVKGNPTVSPAVLINLRQDRGLAMQARRKKQARNRQADLL